jgi:hypothetical protein
MTKSVAAKGKARIKPLDAQTDSGAFFGRENAFISAPF